MGSVFKFKQFDVEQRDCAMKINTDGVLLGALLEMETSAAEPQILDIGTGTGVIALMLAQRYPTAQVIGVDIDETAYLRAMENFSRSVFHERLKAASGTFHLLDGANTYDLIVSNPPFYTNSLHNPDARKKIARHTDFDFFDGLLRFAANNLRSEGSLSLILPTELAKEVIFQSHTYKFVLHRKINIKSFEHTETIRCIITLSRKEGGLLSEEEFIIYKEKGIYSDRYREVLKPYFLAF